MTPFWLVFLGFCRYFRQFSWFQSSVKFPEGLFCRMHDYFCSTKFYPYFYCTSWSYRALNYPEYRFWHVLEVKWSISLTTSMFFQIALGGGENSHYWGCGDGKFCWEGFFYQMVGTWGGEIFAMQTFFKAKSNILWILSNID